MFDKDAERRIRITTTKKKNGARKREEARAGEKREEAGREDDGEIKLGKTQSVLTDEVFGVHGADEKREADAGPLREQTPETTPAERVRRMRGRGKKENLWTFYKKERDESLRESKQHGVYFVGICITSV